MQIAEAQCPVCRGLQPVVCKPIKWEHRDGLEIRCKRCHVDVAVVFFRQAAWDRGVRDAGA